MPTPADHFREAARLTDKALCLADTIDDTGWLRNALTQIKDHLTHAAASDPGPSGGTHASPTLDDELAQRRRLRASASCRGRTATTEHQGHQPIAPQDRA